MSESENRSEELPKRAATMRLSQRELTRISLAIVGLIVLVFLFLGYRVILGFKANHDKLIAQENLHSIFKAFYGYAQDWDQHLPAADHWTDAVVGYLSSSGQPGGPTAALHGPGDGPQITYVYNDLVAGKSIDPADKKSIDTSRMILLIERPGAGPNAHVSIPPQINKQAEQVLFKELSFPHGNDDADNASTVILYANGTQRVVTRRDFR